jgi:hypothetical protein
LAIYFEFWQKKKKEALISSSSRKQEEEEQEADVIMMAMREGNVSLGFLFCCFSLVIMTMIVFCNARV